jgi:hypothetical protein
MIEGYWVQTRDNSGLLYQFGPFATQTDAAQWANSRIPTENTIVIEWIVTTILKD